MLDIQDFRLLPLASIRASNIPVKKSVKHNSIIIASIMRREMEEKLT